MLLYHNLDEKTLKPLSKPMQKKSKEKEVYFDTLIEVTTDK